MSVIADLPDIRPSLLLDFANSRRVHPLIQCTRASTATCYGPDGKRRTVASNVPRIDFDPLTGKCLGLLVEEARTNLLLNSVFAGAASGSPGTAPTNFPFSVANGSTEVIPAGVYTSLRLTTSTAARHFLTQLNTPVEVGLHAFSLPCNFNVASSVGNFLSASAGTAVFTARYFVDGVEIASGTSVGTGKKTVSMLLDVTTAGTISMRFGVGVVTSAVGDVEFSLPQLEKGSFPTSFIPTTTAAATRAADAPLLSGSIPGFNPDRGTLIVSYDYPADNVSNMIPLSLDAGTQANSIALATSSSGTDRFLVQAGGVGVFNSGFAPFIAGTRKTSGIAFGAGRISTSSEGRAAVTVAGVALPVGLNRITLGHSGYFGASRTSGHIARLAYYPVPVTDSQLQRLTA